MHAAQKPPVGAMDAQRLRDLAEDTVEPARFGPVGRGARVAVHGIALPHHDVARVPHGEDMRGEEVGDVRFAVPGYEGDFADGVGGV